MTDGTGNHMADGTGRLNGKVVMAAVHEARKGIRCNAALSGMTATDAVRNSLNDELRGMLLHHTPIRCMAAPEESVNVALCFVSDGARFAAD